MISFIEMDGGVTFREQIEDGGGPVVLVNTFTVPPGDAGLLVAAWTEDAAWMKRRPGFVSTQLHRGIAGSGVFLNYAVWTSTAHFKAAFTHPEFQARLAHYPSSAKVSPHLFRKVAVPGICVG